MGKRLQGRRFRVVFCISFVFLSLIRFRHLFLVLNERLRELIPAGRILTAAYGEEMFLWWWKPMVTYKPFPMFLG